MQQTIDAMASILGEVREEDYLTVVTFSTNVTVLNLNEGEEIAEASKDNVKKAIDYVKGLEANGDTNINDALIVAIDIIRMNKKQVS